ncbi:hypothetical protein WEI85_31915 [Actinomycetes bacterium KLBMP 9797]
MRPLRQAHPHRAGARAPCPSGRRGLPGRDSEQDEHELGERAEPLDVDQAET